MSIRTRGRSRLAALGTAGALAAATLAIAPAASAAEADVIDGAVLEWGTSQYLNEHLTAQEFTDGASELIDGTVTFTGGTGTVDAEAKTATISYRGSAKYGFEHGGVTHYSVTLSDPVVEVEADGSGSIVSDVAWAVGAVTGSAQDVVVTTFGADATRWNRSVVQGTPTWEGAVSADHSYGTKKPVNGASWASEFVDKLPSSIQATFFASGSGNDAKKAPAAFTAQYAAMPSVSTSVLATSYADGVDLKVDGRNFSAETVPGDAGVYVGVAPAPAEIDFGDRDGGMAAMVAVDWVSPAELAGGSFTRVLNLPTSKLTRGTSYAVFTWQAHTASNTTQNTFTPFAIDWTKLVKPAPAKVAPKVVAKVAKAPTTRKAGKAVVRVTGSRGVATGKVRVQVLKGAKGAKVAKRLGTVKLAKGKVAVKLPKLAAGKYRLKAVYTGSSAYKGKTQTIRFVVRKR